jgi:hypothetical protein
VKLEGLAHTSSFTIECLNDPLLGGRYMVTDELGLPILFARRELSGPDKRQALLLGFLWAVFAVIACFALIPDRQTTAPAAAIFAGCVAFALPFTHRMWTAALEFSDDEKFTHPSIRVRRNRPWASEYFIEGPLGEQRGSIQARMTGLQLEPSGTGRPVEFKFGNILRFPIGIRVNVSDEMQGLVTRPSSKQLFLDLRNDKQGIIDPLWAIVGTIWILDVHQVLGASPKASFMRSPERS